MNTAKKGLIRERICDSDECGRNGKKTYGSPMTKESPALTEGTRPNEPTSAAAASLVGSSNFDSGVLVDGTYERMSP